MNNILLITDELKYVCGVSNHIKIIVNEYRKYDNIFNFLILCGSAESKELIDEYNCKVIIYERILHLKRNYINYLKSIFFVKSVSKMQNISIVHSHNHYASNIAYCSSFISQTKTIQTNHGRIPKVGKLNHFMADYHIVLTDRIKDYLITNHKINEERIIKITPGISTVEKPNYNKKVDVKFKVFSSSRLVKEKGLDVYIKAANILSNLHPDKFEFYISGNGEEYNNLIELNRTLGNCVIFVDYIKDFHLTLLDANLFIFTSLSNSEGVPAIIIQAIQAGCLVISSSYDGFEEIFPKELSNMIYTKGKLETLIEKIEYSYMNYGKLLEESTYYYESILKKYSVKNMLSNYYDLYHKLIVVS